MAKKSNAYRVRSLKEKMARLKAATIAVDVVVNEFIDLRLEEMETFRDELQDTLTVDEEAENTVN